ncbi:hypothetical protein G7Y89_g1648 [Cudoniella acicularis]|uniref:ABC transporter n=1 Tax=Cudoniella acicularis TaxID=354080 RepID=A0A8H4RXT1_9HELO|nr:hypothetical protein G7Y89_g1648 [Cudoniella acicularis]
MRASTASFILAFCAALAVQAAPVNSARSYDTAFQHDAARNEIEKRSYDNAFEYDADGNEIEKRSYDNAFEYDADGNEIEKRSYDNAFEYDADGNEIEKRSYDNAFEYDADGNEIEKRSYDNAFEYDADGNEIEKRSYDNAFEYDADGNEIEKRSYDNAFEYDADGNEIEKRSYDDAFELFGSSGNSGGFIPRFPMAFHSKKHFIALHNWQNSSNPIPADLWPYPTLKKVEPPSWRLVQTVSLPDPLIGPITSAALSFVAALGLCLLSYVEHRGSMESSPLNFYGGESYYNGASEISTAVYQHRLNRLKVMLRGALVGLIHHRSLNVKSGGYEDGNSVTLMSSDVDNLSTVGEMFHETWAQVFEVMLGLGLLANQIGWVWPIPLVFIFFCSRVSRYVAKNLKTKQKNWSHATQNRISMITSMLGSAKSMKMLGLSEATKSKISGLREEEIKMSVSFRWMMVAYNASANAFGLFCPVITLTIFAIFSKYNGYADLTADTVFTSLAIFGLVTHPANMVMTIIPRAIASLANFERIQSYLLEQSIEDHRQMLKINESDSGNSTDEDESGPHRPAVLIEDMTISYSPTSKPILMNIDMRIEKGSTVMCSGPVGAGKTSLAKAILGEIPPSSGSVSVFSKRIGICTQTPWLPSGSIKEVVCGGSGDVSWDLERYQAAISACELSTDLENFPEKDNTQIGSRGFNLSGGQRQRVALARALYARCEIVILDDSFSALDGRTEKLVIQKLLGPEGIFKKMGTTIFMITHAAQYFPFADQIVILGNGGIEIQGTVANLFFCPFSLISYFSLPGILSPARETMIIGAENLQDGIKLPDQSELQNQTRTTNDLAGDLARKSGDISLYSKFGQDIQLLDSQLPGALSVIFSQTFKLLSQSVLLFIVQSTMITTLPFCITVVYIVQKIYLRTSRQLRFIDIESRSEVYSSFLETVEGVTTIRAFNWQKNFETSNIQQLEKSQKPFYLLLCLQRWLNLVLDLLIAGIAVGIITVAVVLKGTTTAGQIGIALNLILVANTTLLRLVESWTGLEISLGAIARLKSAVNETPQEDEPSENIVPDESWPSAGSIELDNVTVSYNGKSTLLLTLLHFLELQTGSIKIDGVSISRIPRSILRQRCFIAVPQDPFIFAQASLRFNLDASGNLSDETLVKVLKKTRLWHHFFLPHLDESQNTSPSDENPIQREHETLNSPISSAPPLSTGQLQLLSLSRAILRAYPQSLQPTTSYQDHPDTLASPKPILLLDEATSSLDPGTEGMIQDIIHEEFTEKGYTVIAVAHRASMVTRGMRKERDVVVWMRNGEVERVSGVEEMISGRGRGWC